jgi:hypothetical protein
MEVRVAHELGQSEAVRRLREAARELDAQIEDGGDGSETSGLLVKSTPLGSVQARWEVHPDEVRVQVEKKPAFLPASTIQRMLEEGLEKILSR